MSLPESKHSTAEPQPNRGMAILAVSVTGGTPVPQSGVAQRWTPFSPPLRLVIQRVITYLSISNTGYVRKCHVLSRGRTAEEAELRYLRATLLSRSMASTIWAKESFARLCGMRKLLLTT